MTGSMASGRMCAVGTGAGLRFAEGHTRGGSGAPSRGRCVLIESLRARTSLARHESVSWPCVDVCAPCTPRARAPALSNYRRGLMMI